MEGVSGEAFIRKMGALSLCGKGRVLCRLTL